VAAALGKLPDEVADFWADFVTGARCLAFAAAARGLAALTAATDGVRSLYSS
jgi:hypothetical protein